MKSHPTISSIGSQIYSSVIQPIKSAAVPTGPGLIVSGVTDITQAHGVYLRGDGGSIGDQPWWYLPGTSFIIYDDGPFITVIEENSNATGTSTAPISVGGLGVTYQWVKNFVADDPTGTYSPQTGSTSNATVGLTLAVDDGVSLYLRPSPNVNDKYLSPAGDLYERPGPYGIEGTPSLVVGASIEQILAGEPNTLGDSFAETILDPFMFNNNTLQGVSDIASLF